MNNEIHHILKGGLQAFYVFDKVLTQEEANFLYNNGNGNLLELDDDEDDDEDDDDYEDVEEDPDDGDKGGDGD